VPEAPGPVPDRRLADLPPPGNARRRMLREYGLDIRRSDFSEEELAERGIAVDSSPGLRSATQAPKPEDD
jgi:hypothetical protein